MVHFSYFTHIRMLWAANVVYLWFWTFYNIASSVDCGAGSLENHVHTKWLLDCCQSGVRRARWLHTYIRPMSFEYACCLVCKKSKKKKIHSNRIENAKNETNSINNYFQMINFHRISSLMELKIGTMQSKLHTKWKSPLALELFLISNVNYFCIVNGINPISVHINLNIILPIAK